MTNVDEKMIDNYLSEGYDRMRDEREEEWAKESQESIFDDWKNDNIDQLKKDFTEIYEQEFIDFCKVEFKNWEECK